MPSKCLCGKAAEPAGKRSTADCFVDVIKATSLRPKPVGDKVITLKQPLPVETLLHFVELIQSQAAKLRTMSYRQRVYGTLQYESCSAAVDFFGAFCSAHVSGDHFAFDGLG